MYTQIMEAFLIALMVFVICYVLNTFYITAFYHRGLTHQALEIGPRMAWWIGKTGFWVTGIDPKAWICMHRMHHAHSDTDQDPHSPLRFGVFGVAIGQLRSYENALRALIKKQEPYTTLVRDIPFDVNKMNKKKLWWMPYAVHAIIGLAIALESRHGIIGLAYFLGMMSHPVEGWMVNSLAHKYGYRNHDLEDNSRNNSFVAWFVVGEGYQNNHHAYPTRANFAMKKGEVDLGYRLCQAAEALGMFKIRSSTN